MLTLKIARSAMLGAGALALGLALSLTIERGHGLVTYLAWYSVAAVLLGIGVGLWIILDRRMKAEGSVVNHFYGPATVVQGMRSIDADQPPATAAGASPSFLSRIGFEAQPGRPVPEVVGHHIRGGQVRGPVVVHFVGCTFNRTRWAVDDIEETFWEMEDPAEVRPGLLIMRNCTFEDCLFGQVGVAGTRHELRAFKAAFSRPAAAAP